MIRAVCLTLAILVASLLLNSGSRAPAEREPYIAPFPDVTAIDFSKWYPEPDGTHREISKLFDDFVHAGSFTGIYEIQGEKHWETDEPPGVILRRYRDQLVHPSWNIQGESLTEPVAWLIWTAHDSDGNLWYGSLVATLAGRERVQVWMSLHSDDLR